MSQPLRWVRAALLTAGPLILFGPILVQGQALYWGTPSLQFIPWRELAFRTASDGHLPLWNIYLGMGAPLLANYQSALFYPPNLLLALTGPAWGSALVVLLHLVWAAWGLALLARRLGLGALGQVVGGLAFSLSGYMVARAGFLTINAAAAWLPWLILAAEELVASSTLRPWTSLVPSTAMLGLVFGLQWLAGHAQTCWYSLVLVLLWILWRVVLETIPPRPVRAFTALAAAGALAFGLAAVQLVPTLEYLATSQRSGAVARDFALTYSFWPWRLLGLLAPNLFGNPATGNYWGYGNFWEDAIYVGVLPLTMAIAAVLRQARRGRRHAGLVSLLALVGAGSFLLALGKNTPAFPFLFDHVPTFDLFQAPTRWNLLLVFSLALLAAVGVDGWRTPEGRGLYWCRLGTVGAGVVVAASVIGQLLLSGVEPTFVRGLAWAGGLLCLTGILTLIHPPDFSTRWLILAGSFVLLDLSLAGTGLNPGVDVSVFHSYSGPSNTPSGHRSYMTALAEYKVKFDEAFPFSSFHPKISMDEVLDQGLPNTSILRDRSSANNFDPILPGRYTAFVDEVDKLKPDQQQAILRLMDVDAFTFTAGDGSVHQTAVAGSRRLRVIREAIWVTTEDEALRRVLDDDFHPEETVVLEGSGPTDFPGTAAEAVLVPGTDPNAVEVRLTADGPVWVVLSDVWYPGWRAFIDERPVEIYHADYLFRAVRAPEGEHTIRFAYSPASFWIGGALSAVSWLALAGVMWRRSRG